MTTRILDALVDPAAALAAAALELRSGGVVILPTDTVYGLTALASDGAAVGDLFERKGRSADRRVAVLVADADQAQLVVTAGQAFSLLAGALWPGPLTIVCDRADGFGPWLGEGGATVGVRCPDHDLVRVLAAEVGPIATTSANRAGEPTPADAAGAASAVGGGLLVLDGGPCAGLPSTVLDLTEEPARILRLGAVSAAQIRRAGVATAAETEPGAR